MSSMKPNIQLGDRVVLDGLPDSVRTDDPGDDIFRECLGRELLVIAIEENGDLELDVRNYSTTLTGIYVPANCVRQTR